jgi:hypothetical protein
VTPSEINRIELSRFKARSRLAISSQRSNTIKRPYPFVAWVVLIGIFLPPIQIFIGDTKLTPGRIVVILFLIPALSALLRKDRSWLTSDLFCFGAVVWMIGSSIYNGGYRAYVVAEALEMFGAYLIGRAFFFNRIGIQQFMLPFKVITIFLVTFALFDSLSGRAITLEAFATIFPLPSFGSGIRYGFGRANSTFGHAELYGTFCVAATAIFLYSGRSRLVYSGVGIAGTVFSLSSGPLLGLAVVLSTFCYDKILKKYWWRWKALVIVVSGLILTVFIFANNPVGWIIRHLTLDPGTGYWRVAQWDVALTLISQSPMAGTGFVDFLGGEDIKLFINQSVDCVWLVEALRYGLPMIFLLLLTIFAPFMRFGRRSSSSMTDPYMNNMRTAFSLAVISMGIIGLTVHFWESAWIFFGLCIGIRASFTELEAGRSAKGQNWSAQSR